MSTLEAGTNPTLEDSNRIRWGRIVVGAILLELALIILFIPLLAFMDISRIVPFAGVATFGLGFLVGRWVARKVPGRRVLHGTLAGILATLLYLGLCMIGPGGLAQALAIYGTLLFVVGNGLRIVGCATGAYFYRPN
jgi:hypothetical protein